MKNLALSLLLLLIWCGPARVEPCDCQPIEYDELLTMPVGEIKAKMEQYERLRDGYLRGGSSNCYYTCVTVYQHLYDAKVEKERDQVKARAARRAVPPESAPQPENPFAPQPSGRPPRLITGPGSP
ncbi:hypothetical protein [Geomonas anaerohicana]|uniref:Secreted protein n=1 Tax=Geomonas anaerohicana TaxID=2798583 RepID=A0ABS0YJI2_9BACT|nr:hypothetical protein [Geomonas anaerohicana]MBJ6752488.1 hypothetical protein [Geomonas anaerohicana]